MNDMSTTLCWTPPPSQLKEKCSGLKREIGRFFDNQYNGGGEDFGLVGRELIPFLEGMKAVGDEATKKECQEMIADIEKYGQIHLYIR